MPSLQRYKDVNVNIIRYLLVSPSVERAVLQMTHVLTHMNQGLHRQFQNKFNNFKVQTIQMYPAVNVYFIFA